MSELAELEQKTENLFFKAIQTSVAVLFGIIQSINWRYQRDITEIYAYSRKFRTSFDETEIAVRSKIHKTGWAAGGYICLAAMYIKNHLNHKK